MHHEDLTQLLVDWSNGDAAALERLMPLVYDQLHRMARQAMARERPGHTLQPTALVHEAYLQLIDQRRVNWQNRAHFFGVAAQLMRRVTMLHVRRLHAKKRGGAEQRRVDLDEALLVSEERVVELLAVDRALGELEAQDPRMARIVEMRFYAGLTVEECAAALGISTATVKREWRTARALLLSALGNQPG